MTPIRTWFASFKYFLFVHAYILMCAFGILIKNWLLPYKVFCTLFSLNKLFLCLYL